jgi:hypothetical protein
VIFIANDGKQTTFQIRDQNVFDYSGPENTSRGPKYYKYNVTQTLVFDMQNQSASLTEPQRDISSFKEISAFQYSKLSDVVDGFIGLFKSGNNSDKTQYGWRIYGAGKDTEWQSGLPKSADGESGIDLGKFLEYALGKSPNTGPAEMFKKITDQIKKYSNKDMDQVMLALKVMTMQIDNALETLGKTKDAANLIKEKIKVKETEKPVCSICKNAEDSAHIDHFNGKGTYQKLKDKIKSRNISGEDH